MTHYVIKSSFRRFAAGRDRETLRALVTIGAAREPWVGDPVRKCYVFRGRALTAAEFDEVMADADLLRQFNELLAEGRLHARAQLWTIERLEIPDSVEDKQKKLAQRMAKREEAVARVDAMSATSQPERTTDALR
jgi:hypothetical protein